MKLQKLAGATSEIWQVFIQDSTSATGAGLAGLVFNSAGLTAYYHRDTDTTATAITLVTMTVGTFTSSGFKEIDAVHMPGWYQFCPPNAVLAAGAKSAALHLMGATNMAPLPIEVIFVAYDPDNATNLGLSQIADIDSIVTAQLDDNLPVPGQIAPPVATNMAFAVAFIYKNWRNTIKQTATGGQLLADDGVTVDQKWTTSDDGTTFTKGEVSSGP